MKVVASLLLGLSVATAAQAENVREQARLCETLTRAGGAAQACERALALGIPEPRAGALRQLLARHLVVLERHDDLLALRREEVRRSNDAAAKHRLAALLLHGFGRADEALPLLQEADREAPGQSLVVLDLAIALSALGRHAEALGAYGEAELIEPQVFAQRPGAAASRAASQLGFIWPQAGQSEP